MFLGPLANFTFVMSTTFYLIFVAEAVGGGDYILGLPLVATLIVIQMGIQLVLDYPTGAIGDWIGQRYIVSSATLCYAIAFWLVAMVTTMTPFWFLIVIYAIQGQLPHLSRVASWQRSSVDPGCFSFKLFWL
jgi:hypothetical protein